MRFYTSTTLTLSEILSNGIKPHGDTANGHPAVLVQLEPFALQFNEPFYVVEFDKDPSEVYFDLDDDNEFLSVADVNNCDEWIDRPLQEFLNEYPDTQLSRYEGYGLWVKEVKPDEIRQVKQTDINDEGEESIIVYRR